MESRAILQGRPWKFVFLPAALLALVLGSACDLEGDGVGDMLVEVPGGDPERGQDLIDAYGCGSCHTIPGVQGADGTVGPPLTEFAERDFIAGAVPNNPENLIIWIQDPEAIEPGTAMPDLGVSEPEATDIAAYLYTLD